jgi:regulatory protein
LRICAWLGLEFRVFQRSRKSYSEAELYDYAVRALGRKMRSVAELKRLLRQRAIASNEPEQCVEAVVQKLKEQRYLNDSQYAASYAAYRRDNEKFGKQRVATDLKIKGVHGEVIEKALASAYSGSSEEALARQYLARKRLRKPADQKQAARVFRSLLRAGFGSRTIFTILKKWDVDDETLSALETELP